MFMLACLNCVICGVLDSFNHRSSKVQRRKEEINKKYNLHPNRPNPYREKLEQMKNDPKYAPYIK